MKLNNKGWSLSQMILILCILIIFLFISIFYIIKFYSTIENASDSGKNYINERVQNK